MSAHDDAVAAAMAATEPEPAPVRDPAARVLDVACKIAHNAPVKQGKYVSGALIYWPLIHQLRDALDALGVEWRTG